MVISSSSYYRTVKSDYIFTLQNTNTLPINGKIVFDYPSEWGPTITPPFPPPNIIVDSMTSSFIGGELTFTESYNALTHTLSLET